MTDEIKKILHRCCGEDLLPNSALRILIHDLALEVGRLQDAVEKIKPPWSVVEDFNAPFNPDLFLPRPAPFSAPDFTYTPPIPSFPDPGPTCSDKP